jgi:hypothetical protein
MRDFEESAAGDSGEFGLVEVRNPVRIIGGDGVAERILGVSSSAAKGCEAALFGVCPCFARVEHCMNGGCGLSVYAVLREANEFESFANVPEIELLASHAGENVCPEGPIARLLGRAQRKNVVLLREGTLPGIPRHRRRSLGEVGHRAEEASREFWRM